nr:hypothetical protein CFP56_00950 [Quercus suber]
MLAEVYLLIRRAEVIHISLLHAYHSDGETLKLTTREKVNVSIPDLLQFCSRVSSTSGDYSLGGVRRTKCLGNFSESLVTNLAALLHLKADSTVRAFDRLRNLINILGLCNSLEVIFENFGEVVCLPSEEMCNHQLSILYPLCSSEPLKYFKISSQSGGSWQRQTVQFETIRGVAVADLRFEIGRQVDDIDGVERTFLGADTTPNAKSFGNKGDFAVRSNLDTKLARAHNRTRFLAFLPTFLWLALVGVDNGNTEGSR